MNVSNQPATLRAAIRRSVALALGTALLLPQPAQASGFGGLISGGTKLVMLAVAVGLSLVVAGVVHGIRRRQSARWWLAFVLLAVVLGGGVTLLAKTYYFDLRNYFTGPAPPSAPPGA